MSASERGWGPGWPNAQTDQIVTVTISNGVRLPVRGEISFLVKGLCEETLRRGYWLEPGWCWGFANRAIRGTQTASNHSWGLAVDLNAPTNPMGDALITDMPPWMVGLWKSYGFRWGGDYRGRKDPMHYEFMGTPANAVRLTEAFFTDTSEEDWLDMATQEEVRKIVRDEVRENNNWTKQQIVGSHAVTRGKIAELADPEALATALASKLSGAGSSVTQDMLESALRNVLGSLDED